MVCTVGANLPCGKANTYCDPSAGVVQWCRDNPDASVVPAVATGHDTIYEWRCQGGRAVNSSGRHFTSIRVASSPNSGRPCRRKSDPA